MGKLKFWDLSGVSDERLLQGLNEFIGSGARADARVVAHLAEVEERRLHLKSACSSLFDYCLRRLGLSESEAFHRITAARLARKFPVIFELLETRSIHLSALRLLRDHLTRENHRELLAAASGKSKKEVEQQVVALAPRPDVVSRIRRLPAPRGASTAPDDPSAVVSPVGRGTLGASLADRGCVSSHGQDQAGKAGAQGFGCAQHVGPEGNAEALSLLGRESVTNAPRSRLLRAPPELAFGEADERDVAVDAAPAPEGDRASFGSGARSAPCASPRSGGMARSARSGSRVRALEPLSSARYLLRVSVSRRFAEGLERARDLMSHANPSGEFSVVLERALDLLLEKLEKQRFGQTKRARGAGEAGVETSGQKLETSAQPSRGASPLVEGTKGSTGCPRQAVHPSSSESDEVARGATLASRVRSELRERAANTMGVRSEARRESPQPGGGEGRAEVCPRSTSGAGGMVGGPAGSGAVSKNSDCNDQGALAGAGFDLFEAGAKRTRFDTLQAGAERRRREAIRNEVRRVVAARDGFQCTYVDRHGRRCPCRAFLQLHHERAYALGGASTVENLRLLCGAHNRLLAELDFGRAHQERFAGRAGARGENRACRTPK